MADLDTRLMDMPDWLQPRSPWTQRDTLAAMHQGVQHKQEQQAMALRMRELALRDEATTIMNEARLKQIEEAEAEVADLPLLQEYARNPEMGIPAFQSPKSFNKLQAIDLSRQRSELGKQTALDLKELYTRLAKVSAEDRAAITDMQKAGAPTSEVWGFLGQAEERQRAKLAAEKQATEATKPITPYQQAQLDAQKRRMEFDLEKFDKTHEIALKKLGYTEEQLKLQQEKFKAGKAFAPSEIKKLYNEAADAEAAGEYELADVLQERAKTLARGGRERSIQNQRIETMQSFKMKLLPKLRADPDNKKKTNEQLDDMAEELFNLANAGAPAAPEPTAPAAANATIIPHRPILRFFKDTRTVKPVAP